MRERNRYLTFEVISDVALERKQIVDAVWSSLLRLHGELGASRTSLWVMDWSVGKKRGILKVNHRSVETLKSSIITVKGINGKPAAINVLRTTGTLRKARELL